jgi:hypothetical protein
MYQLKFVVHSIRFRIFNLIYVTISWKCLHIENFWAGSKESIISFSFLYMLPWNDTYFQEERADDSWGDSVLCFVYTWCLYQSIEVNYAIYITEVPYIEFHQCQRAQAMCVGWCRYLSKMSLKLIKFTGVNSASNRNEYQESSWR